MSYLLYFVSLLANIILGLLLEEYRKLARTKAVLSRLAMKNGWNVHLDSTGKKAAATISIGTDWMFDFHLPRFGDETSFVFGFGQVSPRIEHSTLKWAFEHILVIQKKDFPSQPSPRSFKKTDQHNYECRLIIDDARFSDLDAAILEKFQGLIETTDWARYLRLARLNQGSIWIRFELPSEFLVEETALELITGCDELKRFFQNECMSRLNAS